MKMTKKKQGKKNKDDVYVFNVTDADNLVGITPGAGNVNFASAKSSDFNALADTRNDDGKKVSLKSLPIKIDVYSERPMTLLVWLLRVQPSATFSDGNTAQAIPVDELAALNAHIDKNFSIVRRFERHSKVQNVTSTQPYRLNFDHDVGSFFDEALQKYQSDDLETDRAIFCCLICDDPTKIVSGIYNLADSYQWTEEKLKLAK